MLDLISTILLLSWSISFFLKTSLLPFSFFSLLISTMPFSILVCLLCCVHVCGRRKLEGMVLNFKEFVKFLMLCFRNDDFISCLAN